jgi:hypothetical protein
MNFLKKLFGGEKSPLLTIKVGKINQNGGVEVDFDWNDEFIKQLYQRGFQSDSELEAVLTFTKWMFIMRMKAEGEEEVLSEHLDPDDLSSIYLGTQPVATDKGNTLFK